MFAVNFLGKYSYCAAFIIRLVPHSAKLKFHVVCLCLHILAVANPPLQVLSHFFRGHGKLHYSAVAFEAAQTGNVRKDIYMEMEILTVFRC